MPDTILGKQRQAFLAQLGKTPEQLRKAHPQLMFDYLGSLGYAQPTLLERLQAWGIARSVVQTQCITTVGLIADVPPTPPGPLDLLVPGNLNGAVLNYTNVNQVIHCRMAAVKQGAGASTVTVTIDGATPMTFITKDDRTYIGGGFAAGFYITGLTPGAHTFTIAVTGGALGNAAVRLGELVSQSGIGPTYASVQNPYNYYIEMDASGVAPATSQLATVTMATNDNAYDIYTSGPYDVEQWNTFQEGMTARFATETGDVGEGGGLHVYHNRDVNYYEVAGIAYEILNAVLP